MDLFILVLDSLASDYTECKQTGWFLVKKEQEDGFFLSTNIDKDNERKNNFDRYS